MAPSLEPLEGGPTFLDAVYTSVGKYLLNLFRFATDCIDSKDSARMYDEAGFSGGKSSNRARRQLSNKKGTYAEQGESALLIETPYADEFE